MRAQQLDCGSVVRVKAMLLVASGGGWSLVEGVIWAVHQRVLAEHCRHLCSFVREAEKMWVGRGGAELLVGNWRFEDVRCLSLRFTRPSQPASTQP